MMYDTIQKTIIAWVFNHYIACYYFDNVNVNQLKVAFEKGEIELENLPIKQDALKQFDLPMEVMSGVVERLSIKIPLLTLLTEPWTIKISNLTLVVAPTNSKQQPQQQKLAITDYLDSSILEENNSLTLNSQCNGFDENCDCDHVVVNNSEETKLAEFYSSFSETVSSIVGNIFKNIRLEINSTTIVFDNFDHGLAKVSFDHLLMHRPRSFRNLIIDNLTLYLSDASPSLFGHHDDLIKIHIDHCNLDIFDESSNNMQLAVMKPNYQHQNQKKENTQNLPNEPSVTCSEIKCDGNLTNVTIEELINQDKEGGDNNTRLYNNVNINSDNDISRTTSRTLFNETQALIRTKFKAKRTILVCDSLRTEFKFTKNTDDESMIITEKNLQMKFDMMGMQYIHSQKMYETTVKRLKNLLQLVMDLFESPNKKMNSCNSVSTVVTADQSKISSNKLLIVNIVDGLVYLIDDTTSTCAIPALELSLDDFRILQFSGKHQQNGFVFAKIGCNHYNRESSSWDPFLHPWSFNLSWDFKSKANILSKTMNFQQQLISLTSDECADFVLSNSFIDLCDVALKRIIVDFINPSKHWPVAKSLTHKKTTTTSQEFNSIFVLNNESGHRLFFAPMEQNSDLFEIHEPNTSLVVSGNRGDSINHTVVHKLSTNSKHSVFSTESPELGWTTVEPGESTSFEYETLPIYRRYVHDRSSQSRVLLIRIEGWKTLLPVVIDQTGTFYREALSDRILNVDTHIAITINVEESSARKVISIRSPLNLINMLDTTLEVHFAEAKQAFYIKPDHHLAVPLPYLYNNMQIRPCNVGVTVSQQSITWDEITSSLNDTSSRIFICKPISVTNQIHASYSNSQSYKICVSTHRDDQPIEPESDNDSAYSRSQAPVFTIEFKSPLTIVNLLPYQVNYIVSDITGQLALGIEEKINRVDITKPIEIHLAMEGFPRSKPLNIDPGATGSFYQTIEMFDKRNRSLYLKAKIILSSNGEERAVEIIIYAEYWFLNKTGIPLIFKQEGAASEAAGQFVDHEENSKSILLFSFYDTELEPPWLCSMRLGNSQGLSTWCDGFKLEKGSGERRVNYVAKGKIFDPKKMKHLIDIGIRKGYGKYSETIIVTFNLRYGFDPTTKTPKKTPIESPHNYKLTSYNHNTNLAERIAGQTVNLFNNNYHKTPTDINLVLPGFKMALVGKSGEKLIDVSIKDILFNCATKAKEQIIDCSVQDIRIENALSDCESSVMLDRAVQFDNPDSVKNVKPALRLIMDRVLGSSFGATLFRQVQLTTCELILNIEEKLILKLVELMTIDHSKKPRNKQKNWNQDLEKNLEPEEDRKSKYYFDLLRIDLASLQLSVFSSSNIPESLQKLKSYLGLKFFSFEDAKLQLSPYFKMNVSKTFKGVFQSVTRFYKKQILDQAPRIVGQQIQNYLRFHLSDLLSTLYDEVYNKVIIL